MVGNGGRVMWAYAVAAECDQFEIRQKGQALSLVARLGSSDVFKLRQAPLTFEVRMGGSVMRWSIGAHVIENGLLSAPVQAMKG